MERRKPLKTRKGLVAKKTLETKTPLKTKKGLAAKSTLKPRSKKMQKLYKERAVFVVEFLSKNPKCQANWDDNCDIVSVDVHEIVPRSVGGKIVGGADSGYLAVCRYCHRMITDNPAESRKRGLTKWSYQE